MDAHAGSFWFTGRGSSREVELVDGPPDPLGDGVRRGGRIEHDEPAGLGDRHLQESVPDPTMERDVERVLEPGPVVGRLAGKSDLDGKVEEESQVGLEAAGCDRLEPAELAEIEPATVALVGAGRVGEPGADHGRAAGEARLDDLLDELAACRAEQQRIGQWVDRRGRRSQEQGPDALAELGSARLAGAADLDPAGAQGGFEAERLSRLAGAFGSLDRDEPAPLRSQDWACHGASVRCVRRSARPNLRAGGRIHPSAAAARTLGDMGRRSGIRLFLAALALAAGLALPAVVAAHPLGNFTINHYAGLTISHERVDLDIVIDMAEIPAFQERQNMDTDGDGSVADGEAATWATGACVSLASKLDLRRDGAHLDLVAGASSVTFPPGAGGLSTLRLECGYAATLAPAISGPATVTFTDSSYAERIGWREIVATGGGTILDSHGLPPTSPSAKLTAYPAALIPTPLDFRSASIDVRPDPAAPAASGGSAPGGSAVATPGGAAAGQIASTGGAGGATTGAVPGGVAADLPDIFRTADLTPFVILASLLTAVVIGAGHALTPGHGKTLMAAYLVGSRGSSVHAVGLGLSVAVSHTLGIFALAFVIVGAGSVLPPDVVYRVTPVIAGASIVAIGGWMLVNEVRRRRARRAVLAAAVAVAADPHEHARADAPGGHAHGAPDGDGHGAPDAPDHGHAHEPEAAHGHDHPHDLAPVPGEHSHGGVGHSHLPPADGTLSWRGLFVLGLAGGLIPSTSALLILLGSIAAGRPAFGLILVVAFGLGMAAVMTGVGLTMILARTRLDRMPSRSSLGRLATAAPLVASVAVLSLGLVLTWQAVAGAPVL